MFSLILVVSLLSRAFANWSAPMYVASTVLVVAWLVLTRRMRWLLWAIGINVVLGLGIYHYHDIARMAGIELTKKSDPYRRVLGWKRLGEEVSRYLRQHPGPKLLCDDRKVMAELVFYVRPHPFDAVKWNPRHTLKDHYELTTDLQKHVGEDFIYVTDRKNIGDVARRFEKAERLGTVTVPLYKDFGRVFYVYYLHRFKGYE